MIVTPRNIPASDLEAFQKEFPAVHLIRVGYQRPGLLKRITNFFRKLTYKYIFRSFPYQIRKNSHLRNLLLRDLGFITSVRKIASSNSYDLIQVEHTINMGLVEILPKDVPKIFVHHEISHTRIGADLIAQQADPRFAARTAKLAENLELNWLQRYEGIITLSDDDRRLLREKGIRRPISVAEPFAYFEEEVENIFNPIPTPDLLFVGGESHYPNREGLAWFLRDVFPLIREKFPGVRTLVAGTWTPEFAAEHESESVEFPGFVENLKTVMKDHIMIIPVRIGSGVRVKALMAFACGVPVVSTPAGIAGIPGLADQRNILLAEPAQSFAHAVEQLLVSPELRRNISDSCFDLARSRFASGRFARERNEFYEQVFNDAKRGRSV
ncbi:MAG TPA: glycosyltransferase [Chitinophagaceae bacterium]|nr:glycosyltransferase [Chitinophagaceae bacterium]